MIIFYCVTALALIVSYFANKRKTGKALKIACKKLLKILPAFLLMLISVSIVLYFLPDTTISKYLGKGSLPIKVAIASILGSISLMPGFIAFPLSKLLLNAGVKYCVIGAFTGSLMMVGLLTYPVEKKYFGSKLTIYRNIMSFGIVIILALVMSIAFKEVSLW